MMLPILYERETRTLSSKEGYIGCSTIFEKPLRKVVEIAKLNPSGYQFRIFFFTDGYGDGDYKSQLHILQKMGIRIDAIGFGSINPSVLNSLVINGGTYSVNATMDDVEKQFLRIAASD
jgi:hypothetical protein